MSDPHAQNLDSQVNAVYEELKRLAASHIRRERVDHTLSATALLHEAYMKLAKSNPQWETRSHFFGIAANAMRQILIDHANARRAEKRGGEWIKLTLTSAIAEIGGGEEEGIDVLSLNAALKDLESIDARQARVVELRYFGGLSIEETADAMNLSIATIKREWQTAKLFLKRALDDQQ
ncbi:MAG: ECF-type sigma factor [Betaproteobacteria bacterium]